MEVESITPARGRNVIIFSDGTGQVGGIYFDEARTNVYKLFRATRVAPDTAIDPHKQIAFYDPGLGSLRPGGTALQRAYRWVYNLVSQATGLGITQNIIDCYAALIRLWRPGDRIYLFGFSRGAYTVRCLATVLWHCGIPQSAKGGAPLRRDEASCQRIATEAVTKVYQHVSSPRDKKHLQQRRDLGRLFRLDYQSYQADDQSRPNVFPFFIGVFDTVASLWSAGSLILVGILYSVAHLAVTLMLLLVFPWGGFWYWTNWLFLWVFSAGLAAYVWTHLKFSTRLKGYWFWDVIHLTNFRQKFYDGFLHSDVSYARHAMSIDEKRASFPRVIWGGKNQQISPKPRVMPMFEQLWFAGNHADIGGGYPETESRLSDIALKWMVDAASNPALGDERLLVDGRHLEIRGDPLGILHDETRSSVFRWAQKADRATNVETILHDSVLARLSAEAVLQYDLMAPYRPEALRFHPDAEKFYSNVPSPAPAWFEPQRTAVRLIISRLSSSIERWTGQAMESANKSGRLDSAISCVGLLGLVAFWGMAAWIFVFWQIVPWLRDASWQSYPLADFIDLSSPWKGVQMIIEWFLYLPATLVFGIIGIGIFWICGRLASRLYQARSAEAQK